MQLNVKSLLQKIQKNWETYQLALPENKQKNKNSQKGPLEIIVCVSGGSDSVALFNLLHRLSTLLRLKFTCSALQSPVAYGSTTGTRFRRVTCQTV